jgi:hypothetical protein
VTHWERTAKPITRPLKVEELCKAFVLYRQSKGLRLKTLFVWRKRRLDAWSYNINSANPKPMHNRFSLTPESTRQSNWGGAQRSSSEGIDPFALGTAADRTGSVDDKHPKSRGRYGRPEDGV